MAFQRAHNGVKYITMRSASRVILRFQKVASGTKNQYKSRNTVDLLAAFLILAIVTLIV